MDDINKPSGFLLVDKPINWTSFDVVNKIRFVVAKELGIKAKHMKVGHCGTLDPKATGLLVLALGKATKSISTLTLKDKSYEVGAFLGAVSTTGDSEGDLSINDSAKPPELVRVQRVTESFVGEVMQTPHKYSAIKVNGVRAYKLARQGKQVELKARKVTIHSITAVKYDWPSLRFDAKVSSGTYIRSLVEDMGVKLQTGAYMNSLRRVNIGAYEVKDALDPEDIEYKKVIQRLLPLD